MTVGELLPVTEIKMKSWQPARFLPKKFSAKAQSRETL